MSGPGLIGQHVLVQGIHTVHPPQRGSCGRKGLLHRQNAGLWIDDLDIHTSL